VSADVFPIGPGIALKPEPDSAIWPSGALTQSGAVWLLRELPRATEAALDFANAEAEQRARALHPTAEPKATRRGRKAKAKADG
jgi:hypothetical protein